MAENNADSLHSQSVTATVFDKYNSGIEVVVFKLNEGTYLKVEFYEDGSNNFQKDSVRVRDIRVPEASRGQGLGQDLQRALVSECKKRGVSHIYGWSPNPHALLSWLKIPEIRDGFHLMSGDTKLSIKADFVERILRSEIEKKGLKNTDTQPVHSTDFKYVIDLN